MLCHFIFIAIHCNKTAYGLFMSVVCAMNDRNTYFSIGFAIIVGQSYGLFESNLNNRIDNSSEIISTTPDDDIYKCVSYTGAHIDISHWINQEFSHYKDCQTSGLYTVNRRNRQFKIETDVQRSWIVEASAIIYNGTLKPICGINSYDFVIRPTDSCEKNGINVTITETDRFEALCLYYDMGNLTIITTHNKQSEPRHFNLNIWQTRLNIPDSYGLCTGSTCSSDINRSLLIDEQRSSYPNDIILLICDIYIDNYLNSTERQPWERSLHYNSTIENVRKACLSDVQQTDWPHAAAGCLEVLFVEDQVNSENITSMGEIQINFQTNLEAKLFKLSETIDLSRDEVNDMLEKLTTTTTTTTATTATTTATTEITTRSTSTLTTTISTTNFTSLKTSTTVTTESKTDEPNNDILFIAIGCSIGGVAFIFGSIVGIYYYITKTNPKYRRSKKISDRSFDMNELK